MTLDAAVADRDTPTFVRTVGLVAGREITSRLRSKAFLVSTAVLMLGVLASVILPSVLGGDDDTRIAVVGGAAAATDGVSGLDPVAVADRAEGEAMLRDGDVHAVVVPSDGPGVGLTVIGLDATPGSVVSALSIAPAVEVLEPAAVDSTLARLVAFGFGIVFFMSALTFGTTIASSVVEEKQTRIVEILLSTVSARALLTGKIVGNSLMALGQIVAIAVLALLGLAATGERVLLGGLGPSIAWFAIFFVVGFIMLAALYAGTASMVSRVEDVGTTTTPVTMLVMIPYFLVVFFFDDPTVLTIMSYVPFSSPVGMPVRVFLGETEWWEPILSLAILLATTAAAVLIGERIYRNSLLRMGSRVKLGEALGR
ncbi:ABC transporter permease [Agromyces luteolus]|uniref:ABC transporter permease subunit n=1 Tax=Agromyces luteolus TaxID=88373 RepID=A0A7C9HGH3_9MICO|nr:ABC transporter permease [Agromyces luteolus]MUN06327.1 ABC transporter permease subunit [Agromyces luteolus]GLK26640.1 ABC transporter permease [Agromyces luteolus]